MKQHEIEQRVLALWTTTRVPLTRANLLIYTKARRGQLDECLDAMVKDGLLDVDSDAEGELHWTVRGAARSKHGPETLADIDRLARLSAEVDKLAAPKDEPRWKSAPVADRKSVVLSAALSLFFGPMGWLYAGSLKEALPGALFYVVLCSLVPKFLLAYILGPFNAVAALAGVLYAWSYNRSGRRETLILKDAPAPRLPPRR
ncbi:MAG: hypothetical protein QM820_51560 [Minicystis sp.]